MTPTDAARISVNKQTLCRMLDVTPRQLRRLISSGQIPKPDIREGYLALWSLGRIKAALEAKGHGAA